LSQKGHPVLIASFEMKPESIQRKIVQNVMGRPFGDLSRSEKEQGLDFIEELPIHYVDIYGQVGLKELKAAVFKAHKQFGIDFVVLDHLHFFLKYSPDHERQAIEAALVEIKTWAMTLGLHIILVVHPTKLETENRPVKMNDLRGSASLKQVPDNILSIWRPRDPDDLKRPQSEVVLYVLKVRDDDGDEGKIILNFDKRSQSYSDSGPGFARPAEGRKGSGPSSPSSRPPERNWQNGYDL
jgi:KaiC/GvpD/RAD55 family RecA-like ATPase